jgi:hypothetical protein
MPSQDKIGMNLVKLAVQSWIKEDEGWGKGLESLRFGDMVDVGGWTFPEVRTLPVIRTELYTDKPSRILVDLMDGRGRWISIEYCRVSRRKNTT